MNLIHALEEIEAAPLGKERLTMVKHYDSSELRKLWTLALSPDITFGIKKLPEPIRKMDLYKFHSESEWYNNFLLLTSYLSERKLTGKEAQDAVGIFLWQCDDLQRKWSERILKQDLRLNIGAKDVNNTLGKNTIYIFEVPLATDAKKVKPKDLHGKWVIQAKLDGGRCTAVLPPNGGRVRLLSRTGKEWGNFESIRKVLQEYNENRDGVSAVYLDGEVVSIVDGRIDFQSIQKTMLRKDGVEVGELHYIVFDAAREDEWQDPVYPYDDGRAVGCRLATAVYTVGMIKHDKVQLVKDYGYYTDPRLEDLGPLCQKAVEEGYEGLILRRVDHPVENKRGRKLLKYKLFSDDEAVITGYVEGNGKLQGMLGTLVCKTADNKNFEIGSGFSDKLRKELWAQRDSLLGQKASYKYFEMTDDGIPRFPIFRYIRAPEDT